MNRLSLRARIAAVVLLSLSTVTAGLGSLALLTDTFTSNNNFSVASIDLTGNGQQTVTHSYATLFPDSPYKDTLALTINNAGTAEARYSIDTTGSTGNASWGSVAYYAHVVADAPACAAIANSTGSIASGTVSSFALGSSTAGQQTGDRTLAPGASEILCFTASHGAPTAVTGTYAQKLNFRAEQTYQNP